MTDNRRPQRTRRIPARCDSISEGGSFCGASVARATVEVRAGGVGGAEEAKVAEEMRSAEENGEEMIMQEEADSHHDEEAEEREDKSEQEPEVRQMEETETEEEVSAPKKQRILRADVWSCAERVTIDGKVKAKCRFCRKLFCADRGSTTGIRFAFLLDLTSPPR